MNKEHSRLEDASFVSDPLGKSRYMFQNQVIGVGGGV